jgi:hypothetical protein
VGLDLDLRSSVMALPDTDDNDDLFAQVQAKLILLRWPSFTSHRFNICGQADIEQSSLASLA